MSSMPHEAGTWRNLWLHPRFACTGADHGEHAAITAVPCGPRIPFPPATRMPVHRAHERGQWCAMPLSDRYEAVFIRMDVACFCGS